MNSFVTETIGRLVKKRIRPYLSANHFAADAINFLLSAVNRQSADSVCQLRVLLVLDN